MPLSENTSHDKSLSNFVAENRSVLLLALRVDKDEDEVVVLVQIQTFFEFKLKPPNLYPREASEGLRCETFLTVNHFSFVAQKFSLLKELATGDRIRMRSR